MSPEPEKGWTVAALGLGGNIGDPPALMAEALRQFDERDDCRVTAVSRLYSTPPWGKIDQADFFNACALVETRLAPLDLLDLCLAIERSMKRERIIRWGPRTIDIDVLTYGLEALDNERLRVPHPRMTERGFVLMPLADITPGLLVDGKSVADWLTQADIGGITVVDGNQAWWKTR